MAYLVAQSQSPPMFATITSDEGDDGDAADGQADLACLVAQGQSPLMFATMTSGEGDDGDDDDAVFRGFQKRGREAVGSGQEAVGGRKEKEKTRKSPIAPTLRNYFAPFRETTVGATSE